MAADRQPRYRPAAQAELIEAATRYEAAADGLGADFIKAIDDALAVVIASPERGLSLRAFLLGTAFIGTS